MIQSRSAIFGRSTVRRQLLTHFLDRPGVIGHVREVARRLSRAPAVVGRELAELERQGILTSDRIGSARRYRANEASPVIEEVRRLVRKTIGVDARLRQALADVSRIRRAFLYGSYARGEERPDSDIDLIVVGEPDPELFWQRILSAERDLGRDISVTEYGPEEFDRKRHDDPFLARVLSGPLVDLVAPS